MAGIVLGVAIGALMHFAIQIPAIIKLGYFLAGWKNKHQRDMEGGQAVISPFFRFGFESDNFDIYHRFGVSSFRRKYRRFQLVF